MKNIFIRSLAAFILAVMLISAVACAETGSVEDTTASAQTEAAGADVTDVITEAETTAINAENILGIRDYSTETLTFFSRSYNGVWSSDLFVEDATGNVLNDAIYNRNAVLAEKYGIKFEEIESGNATFRSDVANRIATGDTSYQALYMGLADAARYGVVDGDYVTVDAVGAKRTRWYDVQVRVSADFTLEMHVDTDDANAAGIGNGTLVAIVKE